MAFQLSSQTNDIKNFAASLPVLLVLISSASTERFSMKGGFWQSFIISSSTLLANAFTEVKCELTMLLGHPT
jgi:hypothetical protein